MTENIFSKSFLKIFLIAALSVYLISIWPKVDTKADIEVAATPAPTKVVSKPLDNRAIILRDYLAAKHSPLQNHAQDFVEAADANNIDWKLVAAISGVESTFGEHIPGGHDPETSTYNGWGWGVYGDQQLGFGSWKNGIFTVSKGLKEGYVDKGLTDPIAMNRVYAASPTWGVRVNYFLNDIDQFAQKYPTVETVEIESVKIQNINESNSAELATSSAKLAFN